MRYSWKRTLPPTSNPFKEKTFSGTFKHTYLSSGRSSTMSCGKPHRPIDGQNSVFSVAAILQDFTEFFEE